MVGSKRNCRMGGASDVRGMCLTEVLVSLTAGAIVLAATFDMVVIVKSRAERQFRAGEEQQNARIALEVMEQEVRQTSAAWILSAAPDELVFQANVNALETITTGAVPAGQSTVPVQDAAGWGEGKVVSVCTVQHCELHRLARAGLRNEIVLTEPLSVAMPAASSVEVMNRVRYYTKPDESDNSVRLMRMVDGGASTLVGPLREVQLAYWSEDGRAAQGLHEIRRMTVRLQLIEASEALVREFAIRS